MPHNIINNTITIGDKFLYNGKKPAIVTDIIKCWSTLNNEWSGFIYLAKEINGLSTNTFEVSKVTIVRYRIDN